MKSSKRRLISFAMVLVMIFTLSTVLSGCYITHSGKMNLVEGTYVLTSYSGDGNYMEERDITLYIVIRSDGTGYYAYKDKNTEPHIAELRCRFIQDTETPGKYQYGEIDFDGDGVYENFGINARWTEQHLGYSRMVFGGNILEGTYGHQYTISASFDRVSKKTDLSYINEKFGSFDPAPFGSLRAEGN